MSQAGAPAAYRGYRLQALYILDRILAPATSEALVFQPEGYEDLDMYDDSGQIVEVVQVKSYARLVLSDLSPDKPTSFFKRVVTYFNDAPSCTIRLVNFGGIGTEMRQAWSTDGSARRRMSKQLCDAGIDNAIVQHFFTTIDLVVLNEQEVTQRVFVQLQELMTGVDPHSAFDLLLFWLYRHSEQQTRLTRRDVISRITDVGRVLAEQHAHHQEWFTTIVPFEEYPLSDEHRAALQQEFYAGIATRYEHIAAGLDFRRERPLRAIAEAFQHNRVVIVHAASGQGKTAIGLRYMADSYPANWRFRIELIQDRQHVLHIVRALTGFAQAVQAPIALHIDVAPRDTDWPELVQRLASYPLIHTLVTIREEDLRRASITGAAFTYSTVALDFDETEAREIFDRAMARQATRQFLDFDDAWNAFGQRGPLLEFVYLLTQTTTLQDRLQAQLKQIRDDVQRGQQPPDIVRLLRIVALASSYEARLHLPSVLHTLSFPDPARALERLEAEYLVRVSANKLFLEGVHPVRSQIMHSILSDPIIAPWGETAKAVLPLLHQDDVETYLLRAFLAHPHDGEMLLAHARQLSWSQWTGVAGVLRASLWADIRAYIDLNAELIHDAHREFRQAWWIILNFDVANIAETVAEDFTHTFAHLLGTERLERMEAARQRQTSKTQMFESTRAWLSTLHIPDQAPSDTATWVALAEVWSYIAHFDLPDREQFYISDDALDQVIVLDLSTIADVSLALFAIASDQHAHWLARHLSALHQRLAEEYQIIAFDEKDKTLTIHFLFPLEKDEHATINESSRTSENLSIHAYTMERVTLVRKLFPAFQGYGSQGYGHTLGAALPLPHDESRKTGVRVEALRPYWFLRLNVIAHGLGKLFFRPETWDAYVQQVLAIRQQSVTVLHQLTSALIKYHQHGSTNGKTNIFVRTIDPDVWMASQVATDNRPLLPRSAVDPWGLSSEGHAEAAVRHWQQHELVPHGLATQKYKAYHTSEDYCTSLSNFFRQAVDVLVTNVSIAHLAAPKQERMRQVLAERGVTTDGQHLATHNLWDARQRLATYQQEFRQLFAQAVPPEINLADLERQEHDVLDQIWPLWYFFAHQPEQRWSNPRKQLAAQLRAAHEQVHQWFSRVAEQMHDADTRITQRSDVGSWEGKPVVWLQLDIADPLTLYVKLQELVQTLRAIVGDVPYQSLHSYIMMEECDSIAIIPSVRGRALHTMAWLLSMRGSVLDPASDGSDGLWKYLPQTIPDENWAQLNLSVWDHPQITSAYQLVQAVGMLFVRTARLAALGVDLPFTESGEAIVNRYIASEGETIGAAYQTALDTIAILTAQFTSLTEAEQAERMMLREGMRALINVHHLLTPATGATDKGFSLKLDELQSYVDQLGQVVQYAELVWLCWIADVVQKA